MSRIVQEVSNLPANDATAEISDALAAAVKAHGLPGGVVLMLVQPGEKNSYDQQVRLPSLHLCCSCMAPDF